MGAGGASAVPRRALSPRRALALAALAGLAGAAGHVPVALPVLALPGLALTIWLVATAPDARAALWRGWAAGCAYFAGTLFWIVEPFMVDVARHGWMAPFALVGMAGGMAMFWGAAAWIAHRLGTGQASRALAMALTLTLAGILRAYVLTGFPWALPAYVWTETPVIQLTAYAGIHGVGLVTLLAVALPAAAGWSRRGGAAAGLALAVLGAAWAAGTVRLAERAPATQTQVRLVQPNAAQHLKWRRDMIPVFFDRALDLTAAPSDTPPDVVIWPETAMPWLLNGAEPAIEEMRAAAGAAPALIFGAQRRSDAGYHNSLAVIAEGAAPSALYDKHHLVPFGEYLPFDSQLAKLGLYGIASRVGGGYVPGPGPELLEIPGLGRVLPLICYEAVFPQDVFGAPNRPDVLVHITNDAWFGRVAGPYQHLAQSRVRAIEQGLPMLRAANTGVSAVIDAHGRVTAALPLGEAGHLDARLPGRLAPTPYSRWPDWPVLAVLLAGLAGLGARRRRAVLD
mgnify:FL=1